ncbi:hypothetical protein PPGU19_084100 (plasmid) [Paraburkholderia sp. PGU19]|nr:hypothetical protein PPGU19_084100 [Paraburkholderia sp. PGU19]
MFCREPATIEALSKLAETVRQSVSGTLPTTVPSKGLLMSKRRVTLARTLDERAGNG